MTTTAPHITHVDRLITRPLHPTPWLASCLLADCKWVQRFATEVDARAGAEAHEEAP